MKHLLFFLVFIIIANNNLHAYPNKNENIYNYKFSVLELFFKKYYPPAGDSSSIIIDFLDQTNLFVSYDLILGYDSKRKDFIPKIKSNSPVRFSVTFIDKFLQKQIHKIPEIVGKVEIASCDQTELQGANQNKTEVTVTIVEKIEANEFSFSNLVVYRTIAAINPNTQEVTMSKWDKINSIHREK